MGEERARSASWVPEIGAALAAIAVATLCGDAATTTKAMRDVVVGATIAGDHAWTAPLPQILVPPMTLLPLGDVELRASLAMAIPSAIAAALVARRASTISESTPGTAGRVLALALGALAGVLLVSVDPTAALVTIAVEASLRALASRRASILGLALTLAAFATWSTPRLGWTAFVPLFALDRDRIRAGISSGFAIAIPTVAAALLVLLARGRCAWLVVGRPFVEGSAARSPEPLLAAGLQTRSAIAVGLCALVALGAAASAKRLHATDRAAALTAIVVGLTAWVLRPFGGIAVAIVVLLPTAGASLGALHLAVDRFIARRTQRTQPTEGIDRNVANARGATLRVLVWIVPALVVGWSARAFEDVLRAERASNEAAAAIGWTGIGTLGSTPANAVFLVDDEPRLLAWAHDRAILSLRPDVRALPARSLLLGGASIVTARTLDDVPRAADVLRAMIARGELDGPDVSPLAERAPLLVSLSASRLRLVARHFDPTGGPLRIALERVDPSDRRIRRPAIDRRLAFAVDAMTSLPIDAPRRALLRGDALREARLASIALDRDAATFALGRARALGADETRIDAWLAKLRDKKTLENEPETTSDD